MKRKQNNKFQMDNNKNNSQRMRNPSKMEERKSITSLWTENETDGGPHMKSNKIITMLTPNPLVKLNNKG